MVPVRLSPTSDSIAVLLNEVEIARDGGVLREDSDRPAWLRQQCLKASAPKVVLLGGRAPCVHGGAKLNEAAFPNAFAFRGDFLRNVRIDDGVAILEGALAQFPKGPVASKDRATGAVGTCVPAFDADIHREVRQLLLGEFRRAMDCCYQRIAMNSERGVQHGVVMLATDGGFYVRGSKFGNSVDSGHIHYPRFAGGPARGASKNGCARRNSRLVVHRWIASGGRRVRAMGIVVV